MRVTRSGRSQSPSKQPINDEESFHPSTTESESLTRFAAALTKGMDTLLRNGHGRERAADELLRELVGGAEGEAGCCAPDEDEVSGVDVWGRCVCVCSWDGR